MCIRDRHITPRYFSTIIKEKSGNSALQWIVQMVITEAKQLLEGSDLRLPFHPSGGSGLRRSSGLYLPGCGRFPAGGLAAGMERRGGL